MTDSVAKKITPVSSVDIKQKSKVYDYLITKETKETLSKNKKDLPISCEELALWINDKLTSPAMAQTNQTTSEDNTETKFSHELTKLTQYMRTHPREVEAMFHKLPQSVKDKINEHSYE